MLAHQQTGYVLLEQGKQEYMEGRFEEAIEKLNLAIKLITPKDKLIDAYLHLSLCHFALGERDKAKVYLAELLRLNPAQKLDSLYYAPDFLKLLDEAKGMVLASIRVETKPAISEAYFDGELTGLTPLQITEVAPGEHKLRVVKQGYQPKEESLILKEGEVKTISIELEKEKKPTVAVTPAEKKPEVKKGKAWLWILLAGTAGAALALLLSRGGKETTTPTTTTPTTTAPGINQQPKMEDLQGPTSCKWGETVEYKAKGNDPDGNRVSINFWIKDTQSGAEWELGWSDFFNNNEWVKVSVTWSKDKYGCGSNRCQFRIRAKCKDEQGKESNPLRLDVWVETTPVENQIPVLVDLQGPTSCKWGETVEYKARGYDPDGEQVSIRFWIESEDGKHWELDWSPWVMNYEWTGKWVTWSKSEYGCGSDSCRFKIYARIKDYPQRDKGNTKSLNVAVSD